MNKKAFQIIALMFFISLLTCCTYNPFIPNSNNTGSPIAAALGAGAGVGTVAIFDGPKPLYPILGISGGMLGYYLSSLRHQSGGILRAGGNVYTVGNYLGIYIPSDQLFEPNTDEFLPRARPILDSAVEVLERYPSNSIIISGSTSGFFHARWEQRLSERRARKVSAYLWNAGVNNFKDPGVNLRKLTYVGYGDYFPISQNITNKGIRTNSRIQIVAYPASCYITGHPQKVAQYNPNSLSEDEIAAQFCPDC